MFWVFFFIKSDFRRFFHEKKAELWYEAAKKQQNQHSLHNPNSDPYFHVNVVVQVYFKRSKLKKKVKKGEKSEKRPKMTFFDPTFIDFEQF